MAETNIKDVKLKIGTETQFQSKLKDLPLNTLVGITDPIQEGELDSSIIDKLGKANSSLQKPTATLAKESFVKVGIDGSQKFDDKVYATADSAKILEAKLNENIIKDPSKTYLIWKGNSFPNSTDATFKAPAGCTIDWGDGNVETFETASTTVNKHTYSDGIEYHLISLSNYTVVDTEAFSGCSGLTSIIIGNSVTSIGNAAFEHCSGLTSITIPNGVTSMGNSAFWNCSGLTSVTIPDSVISMGGSAFYGCSGLTSITIPNGVTSIEGYAFSDCSGLTSVELPMSVTSIGEKAFNLCRGLKTIRISAINSPTLYSNAFSNTSLEKIIVPKSAINEYKSATGWSTYADKIVYEVDSNDIPIKTATLNGTTLSITLS